MITKINSRMNNLNIVQITFDTVQDMINSDVLVDTVVKTKGYYSIDDGGHGIYIVTNSVIYDSENGAPADGYVDHAGTNNRTFKLVLSMDQYCDFRQAGIKIFNDTGDAGFTSVDTGIILNALNSNKRLIGLRTGEYGVIYCRTQYIDTKGTYFESPRADKIDTVNELSTKIIFPNNIIITDPMGGGFTVASGVRKGGIKGLILKEQTPSSLSVIFSLGNALYSVDTDNIISGYKTDNFFTQGGDIGIQTYQYFASEHTDTSPRDFRQSGFLNREGGTSVVWTRCLPLSSESGAVGFEWDDSVITQGHIYSTMISCTPQLTDGGGYIFRNCSLTLNGCSEEFCGADVTMKFIGTGSYNVIGYDCVHSNTDKPNYIYGVEPLSNGRFGATLNISGTSLGVTGFSGDKVEFIKYGTTPTTILSNAKWDISNTNIKSDPTSSIDYDSWKQGYYYEQFVILKDQLDSIEVYSRNNHSIANIPLESNTHYEITGNITGTGSERAYFNLEIYTGDKNFIDVSTYVNIQQEAINDTTNRGKIFHIDDGTDYDYATGNLYLKGHEQASCTIWAAFTTEVLRIEMRDSGGTVVVNQSGQYTIKKSKGYTIT